MPLWTAKIRLIRRQDLLAALTIAGIFAVAGAFGLCNVVHRVMLGSALDRLMDLSQGSILRSEALVDTAIQQLHVMNASRLARCSPQDLDTLRAQIFRTGVLQDAGWFEGEQIRCSAELAPTFTGTSDLHIVAKLLNHLELYRSDSFFNMRQKPSILVRMGDAYVDTGELAHEFSGPSWVQFSATVTDARGGYAGIRNSPAAWIFTSPGKYRYKDRVYATACSTRYRLCDTVSVSASYLLGRNNAPTFIGLACGGAMGGMVGGLLTLLYQRRHTLERQLYRAIRNNQLHLEYQPIARIRDQLIVGAEVLCRWKNENGVLVQPQEFVRIAEQKNWIGALTRHVFSMALEECGELLRENPGFTLSINLSPYCLQIPGLIPELQQLLNARDVRPTSVALEITENAAAHDSSLIQQIQALRAIGHPIHLDDFGKGYSSLSYLHELRIDAIKIDQAFMQAVGSHSIEVDILPQILSIARNLNLAVVVEGIETAEQQAYIAGISDELLGQGWFYGRPTGCDQLCALVAEPAQAALS